MSCSLEAANVGSNLLLHFGNYLDMIAINYSPGSLDLSRQISIYFPYATTKHTQKNPPPLLLDSLN